MSPTSEFMTEVSLAHFGLWLTPIRNSSESECLIGKPCDKTEKPILFKVTEPSSIPYRTPPACAKMSYGAAGDLLVTTVTEVSPPFLGVPQIWRSQSGYKSIAVSFCDQLV